MSDIAANKAVVRQHIAEAINGRRPELWAQLMTDDFVLHHPLVGPGRQAYATAIETIWTGFPDLHVELLDIIAEDDRVVIRYVERGTHLDDFAGLAPTGRTYEKHGMTLYRLAGGRLAEAWLQEDDAGYQQQLFG